MKQSVRVQNERDRRVLAWPRGRVGDAAIAGAAQVCTLSDSKLYLSVIRRQLGLSVPKAHESLREDAAAERHLAAIYEILRSRSSDAHAGR